MKLDQNSGTDGVRLICFYLIGRGKIKASLEPRLAELAAAGEGVLCVRKILIFLRKCDMRKMIIVWR